MAGDEYGAKQRRRAQDAEDKLALIERDATAAFSGVRGTTRSPDRDEVVVTFTDAAWEACKRLLALAENAA